ncbi:hypothetical protein [Pseudophaeobacter sp.]|uniref:hypothetical protein n=1 Tax=Pseudophaeobacter sp. TaxID=1971739 RepID=UPI0032971E52
MTGWKIFYHSVFLLNHNLQKAVQLSSPLIAMIILTTVVENPEVFGGYVVKEDFQTLQRSLLFLLNGGAGLWVAVSWHRYVLLEEEGGLLPAFHGARVLSYLGTLLIVLLVIVIAGSFVGFFATALGFLGAGLTGLTSTAYFKLLPLVGPVLVFWFFYRLAPLLPAAALEKQMTFGDAWRATSHISWSVLIAGALLWFSSLTLAFIFEIISMQVGAFIGLPSLGALQWASTMAGISILTTIYGITMEDRRL